MLPVAVGVLADIRRSRRCGCNRPVIATPTGGFVEMIETDRSGWLTQHATAASLTELLEELLEDKERVLAAIESGRPPVGTVARSPTARRSPSDTWSWPAATMEAAPPPAPPASPDSCRWSFPTINWTATSRKRCDPRSSRPIRISRSCVVNDGSLRAEDAILFELAERYGFRLVTQPNAGLGAARNAGIKMSRGYYVFPLDADNVAEPEFVERCVEVLEGDESLAFVTSWTRYIDEDGTPHHGEAAGYQPLGNWCRLIRGENMAGDAAAVIRRRDLRSRILVQPGPDELRGLAALPRASRRRPVRARHTGAAAALPAAPRRSMLRDIGHSPAGAPRGRDGRARW